MTPATARQFNAVYVLAVGAVLAGAFAVQFLTGDLPCPLCLLQRMGMLGVMFGGVLNVLYGPRPAHYGVALLSAVFGGSVSARQVLLHIAPGTGSYGRPYLGLHLYTWALITFVAVVVVVGLTLLSARQFEQRAGGERLPLNLLQAAAVGFAIVLAFGNAAAALVECGLAPCPDNPTRYLWWP